jgi:hypothetical protein
MPTQIYAGLIECFKGLSVCALKMRLEVEWASGSAHLDGPHQVTFLVRALPLPRREPQGQRGHSKGNETSKS